MSEFKPTDAPLNKLSKRANLRKDMYDGTQQLYESLVHAGNNHTPKVLGILDLVKDITTDNAALPYQTHISSELIEEVVLISECLKAYAGKLVTKKKWNGKVRVSGEFIVHKATWEENKSPDEQLEHHGSRKKRDLTDMEAESMNELKTKIQSLETELNGDDGLVTKLQQVKTIISQIDEELTSAKLQFRQSTTKDLHELGSEPDMLNETKAHTSWTRQKAKILMGALVPVNALKNRLRTYRGSLTKKENTINQKTDELASLKAKLRSKQDPKARKSSSKSSSKAKKSKKEAAV